MLELGLDGAESGPARVIGKRARWLIETIATGWRNLGFGVIADEAFFQLVLARLVEPTSMSDTARVVGELGMTPVHRNTYANALIRATTRDYRDQIAAACFAHAARTGGVAWCSTTSPPCISRPRTKTTCARSATPRNAESTRRSWSGCWSTGADSHSRSAVSRATRPRPPRSSRSSRRSTPRHGIADMVVVADAGMLSAVEPARAGRGRAAVHRRLPGDQGAQAIWSPISIGTATHSPTGRSSTPSPHGPARHDEQEPAIRR